jgi:hypothetical protein
MRIPANLFIIRSLPRRALIPQPKSGTFSAPSLPRGGLTPKPRVAQRTLGQHAQDIDLPRRGYIKRQPQLKSRNCATYYRTKRIHITRGILFMQPLWGKSGWRCVTQGALRDPGLWDVTPSGYLNWDITRSANLTWGNASHARVMHPKSGLLNSVKLVPINAAPRRKEFLYGSASCDAARG